MAFRSITTPTQTNAIPTILINGYKLPSNSTSNYSTIIVPRSVLLLRFVYTQVPGVTKEKS